MIPRITTIMGRSRHRRQTLLSALVMHLGSLKTQLVPLPTVLYLSSWCHASSTTGSSETATPDTNADACPTEFSSSSLSSSSLICQNLAKDEIPLDIVVVKIGGSSITHKAQKEQINPKNMEWFAKTLADTVDNVYRSVNSTTSNSQTDDHTSTLSLSNKKRAFIVIHGAGSFGHHTAKEFGLQGQTQEPPTSSLLSTCPSIPNETKDEVSKHTMQGIATTRLSVQKLNRMVVESMIDQGLHAVGISPCFSGIPNLQAHGGTAPETTQGLYRLLLTTLRAGLIPVLHGDACLYNGPSRGGILSGDILMELIGTASFVSRAVFVTDVDGVFTSDPRSNPQAQLIREIGVHPQTLAFSTNQQQPQVVHASGSTHDHDVTGGLKVRTDKKLPPIFPPETCLFSCWFLTHTCFVLGNRPSYSRQLPLRLPARMSPLSIVDRQVPNKPWKDKHVLTRLRYCFHKKNNHKGSSNNTNTKPVKERVSYARNNIQCP